MSLGDKIRLARMGKGITQQKMADEMGITKAAYSGYETGRRMPDAHKLSQISAILGVSLDYVIDADIPSVSGVIPIRKNVVPLIGTIAAGQPIFASESTEMYLPSDTDMRCDFALRVKGDSMEPYIKNGDIVFIRRQNSVSEGEIAAVAVGDEATLKHVYHDRDGILLIADNPEYKPIRIAGEDCETTRILGLAVSYMRMIGRRVEKFNI